MEASRNCLSRSCLTKKSSPEGEAEQGAREGLLQAAAKVQVGREGVWELPQQVLSDEKSSPEGEAEQGAREGLLQAAAKVQVGREGVWELPQQVCPGEVQLEPWLCGADARQVACMRVKHDQVLPAHEAAHSCMSG